MEREETVCVCVYMHVDRRDYVRVGDGIYEGGVCAKSVCI